MKMYRVAGVTFALLLALAGGAAAERLPCAVVEGASMADRSSTERLSIEKRFDGERFVRTELFFGSARPGGEVSEAEFRQFLDQCVTPHSPTASRS